MAERIKLGGLWMNRSKDGVEYMTGKLSPTVKILIFKNNFKQPGDNQPTHVMYLAPIDPDPNQQRDQNTGSGFFGEGSDLGEVGGGEGGDGDPFESDATPRLAAPPARPNTRPAQPAVPPSRPLNAATTNTRPAASGPPNRRPAPAPPAEDLNDFDDPFAEG